MFVSCSGLILLSSCSRSMIDFFPKSGIPWIRVEPSSLGLKLPASVRLLLPFRLVMMTLGFGFRRFRLLENFTVFSQVFNSLLS